MNRVCIFHIILSRKPIVTIVNHSIKDRWSIMIKEMNTLGLIVSIHFFTVAAQNTLFKSVNIPAGSNAVLTCELPNEGFGGFQRISWKRRNEVLLTCTYIQDCNTETSTLTMNDNYSVLSQESPLKSTLTIRSVSAADSLYTCSITTFDFGQECVFNISITGKKIDEQSYLWCYIDYFFRGNYYWGGGVRNWLWHEDNLSFGHQLFVDHDW